MDRHRRLGTMGPTVREIYKLDDIAYFGKFCKQVSWKKILFWGLATPGFFLFLFFYQGFLSRTLKTHRAAEEGRGHLFATLHVRWLSHIFNRITCIYQTATRWVLVTPNPQHLWILLRLFYQIYKDGSSICQLFTRSLNRAIKKKNSWRLCLIKWYT